MEELYQDYKDIAAIYIVYISEAHAADDRNPVGYATEMGIMEHTNYGERCDVAARLVADKKLTIPCLIDGIDNGVAEAYAALPDRVFLVRKDGTLAVAGNRGPWGFKPALDASLKWLAEYKSTGVEPAPIEIVDSRAKTREINRKMMSAYQSGEYDEAVKYALEMNEATPNEPGTIYNVACFQCLAGNHDAAYEWLEKAIDAGYDDADHLVEDDDFSAVRDEKRFQNIVSKLRAKSGDIN